MENEPDIVKELKKAERLGQLKSLSQTVIEKQKSNIKEDLVRRKTFILPQRHKDTTRRIRELLFLYKSLSD